MRRLLFAAAAIAAAALLQPAALGARFTKEAAPAQAKPAQAKPEPAPVLVVTTSKGVIEIEMFPAEAPKSVARIVELAKQHFYRGTRFHWVQPAVVQFGDQLSRDMTKKDQWGSGGSGLRQANRPIGVAEFSKRKFERGIVGYAYRTNYKPETADSQLFIMKFPNPALNGKYAVIGRVIGKGMAVVGKIEADDMIKDCSIK